MDRHTEALDLARELLDDVELSRLKPQQLVLKASRLARFAQDERASKWLWLELHGYTSDGDSRTIISRTMRAAEYNEGTPVYAPLSNLEALANSVELRLSSTGIRSVEGDWALAVSRAQQDRSSNDAALLARMRAIESDAVARVHDFVAATYERLLFSDLQGDLLRSVQYDIDSKLGPMVDTALDKIGTIAERLRAGDAESVSNAMSTCRRLITAAADALYPPRDEQYMLGDQPLNVGSQQVLNRLQAYVADRVASSSRRDRLRRAMGGIWKRASIGDHADVDLDEARYIFLHTYVVLGELLSLPDGDGPEQ